MELTDLKPRASKFYMEAIKRELKLRPWTVEDHIWLQQEYGKEKVQSIFNPDSVDMMAMCRIAYRLITDKSFFSVDVVETYDEEGNKITEKVGGWKKMAVMLSGVSEQVDLFTAITECLGVSMPEVEDIKADIKKKVNQTMNQPTGQKLSTSLATNTDGPQNTSSVEHSAS